MFNHFEAGAILCNASCAVTLGGFIETQTALFSAVYPVARGVVLPGGMSYLNSQERTTPVFKL
jgi:hypothetical protein